MASLAPSISHAVAAKNGGASWLEICTSVGSKFIKASDAKNPTSSTPAEKGMHFDHCPFCFTHAVSFGLLPNADAVLPVVSGKQPLPPLYYQSPHPLFIWAAAQSRAPPVLS